VFHVLMHELPQGALAFDLLGNAVPIDAAGSPMAGAIQSATAAGARGATALGRIGAPDDANDGAAMRLERQFVRYTLIAPGGAERVFERTVAERSGSDADLLSSLAQQTTVMVDVGTYPDAFVIDRYLAQLLTHQPVLEWLIAFEADPSAPLPDGESVARIETAWLGHLFLNGVVAAGAASLGPDRTSYRPSPGLVAYQASGGGAGQINEAIDIIANPRRVVMTGGDELAPDTVAMIVSGTWETRAEGLLLAGPPEPRMNTFTVLETAAREGIGLTVLAPDQAAAVGVLDLDAASRQNVLRDLESGYAVIIPERMPLDNSSGWWRVSLRDGETLGVIGDGRGADVAQYSVMTQIAIGAAAVLLPMSFACLTFARSALPGKGWTCLGGLAGSVAVLASPPMTIGLAFLAAVGLFAAFMDTLTESPVDRPALAVGAA
jgi:hypothetical protein